MAHNRALETILWIPLREGACPPVRMHESDAGYDLTTCQDAIINPGRAQYIPTGIAIAPPQDMWFLLIRRSSTIKRYGVLVLETVLDSGYRGEIEIPIFNPTDNCILIDGGTRLAQIVPMKSVELQWLPVTELPESDRGGNGFGSTGK